VRDSVDRPVVKAGEELEVFVLDAGGLAVDSKLVLELADSGVDDARDLPLLNLSLLIHL
jgi:hypothetical protein